MDMPFYTLQRDKWLSRAPAAERSEAVGAGLVFNKNKSESTQFPGPGPLVRPRSVLIDAQARRCRRMRTTVEHAVRLIEDRLSDRAGSEFQRWARKFVTLTYRSGDDWSPKHVADYLGRVRKWAAAKRFRVSYVWVAETQTRGAIHYHLLVWVPSRFLLPKPDRSGWWKFGSSKVETVRGGATGACGYITKYVSKGLNENRFPKGARMHGSGGLSQEMRRHVRYWQAPYWVREAFTGASDIRRVAGGWCDRWSGAFIESPWKVVVDACGLVWAVKQTGE